MQAHVYRFYYSVTRNTGRLGHVERFARDIEAFTARDAIDILYAIGAAGGTTFLRVRPVVELQRCTKGCTEGVLLLRAHFHEGDGHVRFHEYRCAVCDEVHDGPEPHRYQLSYR